MLHEQKQPLDLVQAGLELEILLGEEASQLCTPACLGTSQVLTVF